MELLDRHHPLVARSGSESSQTSRSGCSTVKIHCLIAILLLVSAANSGRPDDALMKLKGFGIEHLTLATAGPAPRSQILASGQRLKINIDGFNRQRDIEIAKDSRKLLSLAVALKAELDRNQGQKPSSAAISKARAIEKLARDVKRKMQMAPELGSL